MRKLTKLEGVHAAGLIKKVQGVYEFGRVSHCCHFLRKSSFCLISEITYSGPDLFLRERLAGCRYGVNRFRPVHVYRSCARHPGSLFMQRMPR